MNWTIAAALFGAVAAAGVIVQLGIWWNERATVVMEFQISTHKALGTLVGVRNVGNVAAIGFFVTPVNCVSAEGLGQDFSMRFEPGEHRSFFFDDVEESSHVLFTWNHPLIRTRSCRSWTPVEEGSEFDREFFEQKTRGRLASLRVRIRTRGYVGPYGSESGNLPRSSKKRLRKLAQQARRLESLGIVRRRDS